MSLKYFACADNCPLVEIDDELALSLYKVAGRDCPEHHRRDEESDDEFIERDTARAKKQFATGEKKYVDEESYIFGTELDEIELFKLTLKHGTQTREEFIASNRRRTK